MQLDNDLAGVAAVESEQIFDTPIGDETNGGGGSVDSVEQAEQLDAAPATIVRPPPSLPRAGGRFAASTRPRNPHRSRGRGEARCARSNA